jgi:hypothetical protein
VFGGKSVDTGEAVTFDEIFVGVTLASWVCVRKAVKVMVAAEPYWPWSMVWFGLPEIPGRLQAESTAANEKYSDKSFNVFNFFPNDHNKNQNRCKPIYMSLVN